MKGILTVRDDSGREIPIPAIRGKDGKTPVKKIDYFTEEERTEFVNEVLAALPTLEMTATLDDGRTVTYRIYGEVVTE